MKKVAFIDFDGTLSKGYISMGFLDYLFKRKLYPSALYRKQMELLKKHKEGKLSYGDWCCQWGILWARGLKGKKVKEIEGKAKSFFKGFEANIYPSSYKLIKILKEKGYHTLLVSTSAYETISLAAAHLGIDEIHSTKVSSSNGIYLGYAETNLHMPEGKKDFVDKIVNSGKYNRCNSIALGDSINDAPMLEKADIPIALNPSKELTSLAKQNKWIILNHKNVASKIKHLL